MATTVGIFKTLENHVPVLGNINYKDPLSFHGTFGVIKTVNMVQMLIAEAYMNGLEIPDSALKGLFNACMPVFFQFFPSLLTAYEWVLNESQNVAEGSQDLMAIQYDLPQEMFNLMLGSSTLIYPKYTVALWDRGACNLEQAQMQMMDDVIEKLDIKDGDQILDVGCGWGSLVNYILAKFPNAQATGLNLSHEQCEYIRHKMNDPQSYLSSDRFTLYEGDFNDAKFDTKFDKIVSLGVFEHVGNLTQAFRNLASFLKEDGKVFIHIMTIRTPNNVSSVFTHKYIFPYGRFWNYDVIKSKNKDLKTIKDWYINGLNYSKTYENWLNNFDANQERIKQLDFGMNYGKFRRMWRFYLIWFARNFAACDGHYNGNGQYLMVRA
ncbi:class I SAM-dependent methyltransferase [Moorena sp. SIO3H5]|uniref:SAM-dependent methyltransferase n=1 Tax=Moorena sp. SIO3H5 TaxID=2607834 RepID=UPI0013BA4128|nr:class I SAM-dependent methyltransferase [Moorena sp. SIO3H5]NEO72526.1 class I SAM-dependent methyltransferase [Moorena sp. SIO3H5]